MIQLPEHIKQAQENFLNGRASNEELALLEQWFQQQPATIIEVQSNNADQEAITRELNLYSITQKLQMEVEQPQLTKMMSLRPYIRAAAVLLLVAGSVGLYYYISHSGNKATQPTAALSNTEIAPGSNKATLTLSNGKTIVLDNANTGLIAQQGNVSIDLSKKGELTIENGDDKIGYADATQNTLTVPRGGEFKLVLPDGSTVRLNADSKLRFPSTFTGKTRQVELEGEAYFDITANKAMPFHVKAHTTDITVLGTRFNVSTYSNEPQKTTLVTGRVKVNVTNKSIASEKELEPGQQASIQANGRLRVATVDIADATGWIDNMFVFAELPLGEALKQIGRWYDIDIKYENGVPDIVLNGSYPRNTNLSETLQILKKLNVHYRINNRQIVILPS